MTCKMSELNRKDLGSTLPFKPFSHIDNSFSIFETSPGRSAGVNADVRQSDWTLAGL